MAPSIVTGGVHHLRLTVTDIARSEAFYTDVVGFKKLMDLPPGVLLHNGTILLGLGPSPDPDNAPDNDRFSEARVGLDHLSFSVASRADLDSALQVFDQHNVSHGEIKDLGPDFGIAILAFRDPDNIQLELTSPRE